MQPRRMLIVAVAAAGCPGSVSCRRPASVPRATAADRHPRASTSRLRLVGGKASLALPGAVSARRSTRTSSRSCSSSRACALCQPQRDAVLRCRSRRCRLNEMLSRRDPLYLPEPPPTRGAKRLALQGEALESSACCSIRQPILQV